MQRLQTRSLVKVPQRQKGKNVDKISEKMAKRIISLTIDAYVFEWLKEKGNISAYINNLVKEKMKQEGVNVEELDKRASVRITRVKQFILDKIREYGGEIVYGTLIRELEKEFSYLRQGVITSHIEELIRSGWLKEEIREDEYARYKVLKIVEINKVSKS